MNFSWDDRESLDAFRRGDEKVLLRVYLAYAGELFAFLKAGFSISVGSKRLYFNGYKEAWRLESAVQDVFSRAFLENARLAFDAQRPFRNYLFTIARNRVIDDFRQEKPGRFDPREFREIDEKELVLERSDPTPEQATADRELKEQVELFVSSLDERPRNVFRVRFVEGCSIEETSVRLGLSQYRVKRDEKNIKTGFFFYMRKRGYFKGYGTDRLSVEKLISTTMFMMWMGSSG